MRRRGRRLLVVGLAIEAVAILVTFGTYSAAQESGGTYVVVFGPMILGVFLVLGGLVQLARARQESRSGWRPDPTGRHDRRWWDGTRWSSDVSDGGAQGHDPVPGTEDAASPPQLHPQVADESAGRIA